jgi:hypothetical protein
MCKRFERMMKCLELSASPNDAEALAAIRAANKIREELGLKWAAVPAVAKPAASDVYDSPEVEREFAELWNKNPSVIKAIFPDWRTRFPEFAD